MDITRFNQATHNFKKISDFLSIMLEKGKSLEDYVNLLQASTPVHFIATIISSYFPEVTPEEIMEIKNRATYNTITIPKYLLIFFGFKYFEDEFKKIEIPRQTKSRALNSIKQLLPTYEPHKIILEKSQKIDSLLKDAMRHFENPDEITKEISNLFLRFNKGFEASSIQTVFENDKKIIYNMHVTK